MARRYCFSKTILSFAALGIAALASGTAEAESCEATTDCDAGFVCEIVGGSTCAAEACPEGAECEPTPPCEPTVIKECVPGPCATDSDCSDGMVCLSSTSETCSGGAFACAPNQECPEPPPPECTTTTRSQCAPKYMAPCSADADCGEGFACVDNQQCTCSGSGGTPTPVPASEGDATPAPMPMPPDEDCACTSDGTMRCELKQIACSDASQCPQGFACGAAADTPSCPPQREGEPADTCESATPTEMFCVPPYYSGRGYDGGTTGSASESDSKGSPLAPTQNGSGSDADADSSSGETEGGCQLGAGNASGGGSGLLLLLGLVGLRRRRAVQA